MENCAMEKSSRAFVIGITGGMGAGKTTFAKALAQCGAHFIDVDEMAHELIDSSPKIKNAIKSTFGKHVFDEKDRLDREKLGALVFSDPSLLNALNRIVWPSLTQLVQDRVRRFSHSRIPLVLDMAVLYETGCHTLCDYVIAVDAPIKMRVERLMRSRNWPKEEAERRVCFQKTILKNIQHADRIIRNVGSIEWLKHEAEKIYFALFPHRKVSDAVSKKS